LGLLNAPAAVPLADVEGAPVLNMDARNGFAPPPVICGLKPTPNVDPVPYVPNAETPVGWVFVLASCELKGDVLLVEGVLLVALEFRSVPGVPGLEPGIGGNDSRSEAPKEDEGLKALSPLNPVTCGLRDGEVGNDVVPLPDIDVAPVC